MKTYQELYDFVATLDCPVDTVFCGDKVKRAGKCLAAKCCMICPTMDTCNIVCKIMQDEMDKE